MSVNNYITPTCLMVLALFCSVLFVYFTTILSYNFFDFMMTSQARKERDSPLPQSITQKSVRPRTMLFTTCEYDSNGQDQLRICICCCVVAYLYNLWSQSVITIHTYQMPVFVTFISSTLETECQSSATPRLDFLFRALTI